MHCTSSARHSLMHFSTSDERPLVGAASEAVVVSWALATAIRPATMTGVKRMLTNFVSGLSRLQNIKYEVKKDRIRRLND